MPDSTFEALWKNVIDNWEKDAAHGECTKAPTITMSSEMNGESPGSDNAESPETRKSPARTGATFSTPP